MFCNQYSMRDRWIFIYLVVFGMWCIAPVSAHDNWSVPNLTAQPSPASHYFIYLDPLGIQSVGDVFFINGTTNLPQENLTVLMTHQDNYLSSYFGSAVPIQTGKNRTNFWSCNISTTTQFQCFIEEAMIERECPPIAYPTDYILDIGPEHYKAEYGSVGNMSRFYFYPSGPIFVGNSNFPEYQLPSGNNSSCPKVHTKNSAIFNAPVPSIWGLFLIVFWKNGRV